jgi:hypothetical protein
MNSTSSLENKVFACEDNKNQIFEAHKKSWEDFDNFFGKDLQENFNTPTINNCQEKSENIGKIKNTSSLITDYSNKKSKVIEIEHESHEEAPAGISSNISTTTNESNSPQEQWCRTPLAESSIDAGYDVDESNLNHLKGHSSEGNLSKENSIHELDEYVQSFLKENKKEVIIKKKVSKKEPEDKEIQAIKKQYFGQKEVEYSENSSEELSEKDEEIEMKFVKKKNKK